MQKPLSKNNNGAKKVYLYQNSHLCLVLSKLLRLCNDTHKARIFESYYDMKCSDILRSTNLCNNGNPIHKEVLKNQTMSKFLYEYAKDNFAVVNAFIKDPYYTLIKRDESMPLTTFMGSVGGNLSLLTGMSTISLFEILYHVATYIYQRLFVYWAKPKADQVEKF